MKFKVKLRLTDSGGIRKKYSINLEDGVKFMIGRGTPGLGTDLSHPSVSSQHCFLAVKDHLVWVTDNQSRNGTFLNQKRIDSSLVRVGDMLQIGDYVIEFLEAPMPAVKKDNASTQFIDIAEMTAEEQEALRRVGAVGPKPREATQVLSRSGLFGRTRGIDVPKLRAEAAEAAAKAEADEAAKATVTPAPPKDIAINEPTSESTKETPSPLVLSSPPSPSSEGGPTSSIDLASLDSESAAAPISLESPAIVEEPDTKDPLVDLGERKTDEINRPSPSIAPAEAAVVIPSIPLAAASQPTPEVPPKPSEPADHPESFMPPELMPTGMTFAVRGFGNKLESAKKDEILETPKIVTKLETSAPFTKPVDPELSHKIELKPSIPVPAPETPKAATPSISTIPPAPQPGRRKEDEPDTGSSSPIPAVVPAVVAADDERKKQLVNKHLKKPVADTPPPAPATPSQKKSRASDRAGEDFVAARVGPAIPPVKSSRLASHGVVSTLIAFSSFAACGGAVASMGGGPFHVWMPPVYGIVGTIMVFGFAWLLNHYNEFMEADGEFREYHRMLALAAIPIIFLGALSHASALYRLPAYVLYGVILFNVFMTRFKPLAERFLFLAGSYVASFAFIVYVATSWDTIVNSAVVPPTPEVAATDSNTTAPPAEVVSRPVLVAEAKPTPVTQAPPQTQTPTPDNGSAAASGSLAAANSGADANSGVSTAQTARPEPDSFAMSELLTAAQQGDAHIVHSLIVDKGVNPNTVAENGMTALMYAAYNGHLEVAKALVSNKADVNMRDRRGTTALMWAAYNGKQDMTAYLIQSGADITSHRNDNDSALDIAKRWEHSDPAHAAERAEVVRYLENPALARAAHIPSDPVVAQKAPTPQTVKVTTPPAHRIASRKAPVRRVPAATRPKRAKKSIKAPNKFSATTSDDSKADDDDDSDARARAVKSLKIGQ